MRIVDNNDFQIVLKYDVLHKIRIFQTCQLYVDRHVVSEIIYTYDRIFIRNQIENATLLSTSQYSINLTIIIMKVFQLLHMLMLFAALGAIGFVDTNKLDQTHTVESSAHWSLFQLLFGKRYNSHEEVELRRQTFQRNFEYIRDHNAKHAQSLVSYRMNVNQFADLQPHEINAFRTGFLWNAPRPLSAFAQTFESSVSGGGRRKKLPKQVNWVTAGAVTAVRNQRDCAGCWAFAAVASLEGQQFRKTGELVPLSEQNLIDCSTNINQGCSGGLMTAAYEYVRTNGGIDKADGYPNFAGKQGTCVFNKTNVGSQCTGYVTLKCEFSQFVREAHFRNQRLSGIHALQQLAMRTN